MPNNKSKNVTLKDVAKKVGVSAMTVSRALSGKTHLVRADTAERCRKAAEELGYVPNLMARSLRGEQLDTIVMFAEYISSHQYLAELVDVVSRSIEARKFSVISCQSLASFHKAVRNFNLAGAIIIAPPEDFYDDPFGERAIGPTPSISTTLLHSAVEQTDFSEVSPDIAAFCYHAASHLVELGHKHLAYIGGPRAEQEPHWFDLRKSGLMRAMREHHLPPENLRQQACHDADSGPAALKQLLAKAPETSAVMCINDEIAIATLVEAAKQGLQTPGDLSVIGCNDIQLARLFQPALTTIGINIPRLVDTALDLLFDEMQSQAGNETEPIKIRLPANLIVRKSTGPPAKT